MKKTFKTILFCILLFLAGHQDGFSQGIIVVRDTSKMLIGKRVGILEDKSNSLMFKDVVHSDLFRKNSSPTINRYFNARKTYWIRFSVTNESNQKQLFLILNSTLLDDVKYFKVLKHNKYPIKETGLDFPFKHRLIVQPSFVFDLGLPPGDTATYFLKIKSEAPLSLPIIISNAETLAHENLFKIIMTGIFSGLILSIFLYNLFIYFSTKEITYLYYVLYILSFALMQIALVGYTYQLFWPGLPHVNKISIILFPSIAGITVVLFSKKFLETKTYVPRIGRYFNIFIFSYIAAIILAVIGAFGFSYRIIDFTVFILVIYGIAASFIVWLKGNRAAMFYLISFIILVIAICLFVLTNTGMVHTKFFPPYSLYIGTSIQAILLSFALADKINIYKKEKEISQAKALQASLEKEQFVREQNVILESKVRERTNKLAQSNTDLTLAMNNLKKAESQLVHAEKMASLGQLTAGIAHEINNPINFVKSNIKPLKLDIRDMTELIKKYKQINKENIDEKLKEIEAFNEEIEWDALNEEITSLLNGIEEGSTRTADIVRGLRTFSRLDEDSLKEADIHAGIDATLTLLMNTMPKQLTVAREYGNIPLVECYAGKLNQVFMNILTNSIQAVNAKPILEDEKITITTKAENNHVIISVADTGIGIPETIKDKIFDPFFTTKDIGEGTGLGLSMTFSIIQNHHGHIEVRSDEGKGSEFIITIPVRQVMKV